ncbi:MAG: VOC family protein [Candidatus Iainarchaeum archaeon]|uniref:VOC family protein n=1 Tax=Candidatus Iainarchaeum sp. TaxID=3101447 RepID=A0A7T9DKS7_9ARCH|nr:MAG: VOC family protein [Candidatus Diapherotrites archaeon]
MDKVVHFEIPAANMNRARRFYENVFGWQTEKIPHMDYVGLRSVKADKKGKPVEKGAINGGLMKRGKGIKGPVIAMNVKSVTGSINKVLAHKGKLVMPKTEIMGMGWYAYVKDSEGNVIGLWQDKKKK